MQNFAHKCTVRREWAWTYTLVLLLATHVNDGVLWVSVCEESINYYIIVLFQRLGSRKHACVLPPGPHTQCAQMVVAVICFCCGVLQQRHF